MPELKFTWSDGGLLPTRPEELPDGEVMGDWSGGNLYIGTKGKIISSMYGGNYKLLPLDKDFSEPAETLERVKDDPLGGGRHEMDWVRACKEDPENRKEACASFDYAGPETETVLMGNLAIRLQQLNRKLIWNGEKMKIENIGLNDKLKFRKQPDSFTDDIGKRFAEPEWEELSAQEVANEWINHTYREGWNL
jgi:hypothetical protein